MSTAQASAAMTSYCVDFVNEDDARSILLALLKEVAHPACAHANKHFHEIRSGNGKERNIRLASHRPRQKRLASSRRSDQQHAFRNAAAQFLKFLRLPQELDNLLQLFFCFIHARHVLERD